jgi:hypothetical protein
LVTSPKTVVGAAVNVTSLQHVVAKYFLPTDNTSVNALPAPVDSCTAQYTAYVRIARRFFTTIVTGESFSEPYGITTPVLTTALTDAGRDALPGAVARQYTAPGKLLVAVKATVTVALLAVGRTVTAVMRGIGGTMLIVGRDDGRDVGWCEARRALGFCAATLG